MLATLVQLSPPPGQPVALVGTFLLAATFYGVTAFLAARYVLGPTAVLPAAGVGLVLAVVSMLLGPAGPAVVIVVSVAADVGAIKGFYGLDWRETALVTVGHVTLSVIMGVAVFNLVRLLG